MKRPKTLLLSIAVIFIVSIVLVIHYVCRMDHKMGPFILSQAPNSHAIFQLDHLEGSPAMAFVIEDSRVVASILREINNGKLDRDKGTYQVLGYLKFAQGDGNEMRVLVFGTWKHCEVNGVILEADLGELRRSIQLSVRESRWFTEGLEK